MKGRGVVSNALGTHMTFVRPSIIVLFLALLQRLVGANSFFFGGRRKIWPKIWLGFYWTLKIKAQYFWENFETSFVRKFAPQKVFRANFVLQTCHPKSLCSCFLHDRWMCVCVCVFWELSESQHVMPKVLVLKAQGRHAERNPLCLSGLCQKVEQKPAGMPCNLGLQVRNLQRAQLGCTFLACEDRPSMLPSDLLCLCFFGSSLLIRTAAKTMTHDSSCVMGGGSSYPPSSDPHPHLPLGDLLFTTTGAGASGRSTGKSQYW